MLVPVLVAGSVLFFINCCRTPMHFVGYQVNNHKAESSTKPIRLEVEFSQNDYHRFSENGCEYFQHKKSMYYYAICQKQEMVFIGTDVRETGLTRQSTEDILKKLDQDATVRISKVKALLTSFSAAETAQPRFTVYTAHDLTEF